MRSHAKAPSVGSSAGGGRVLGSPGRAPALLILALCLLASACLLPGSALAAETRPQIGSFGPDGTNTTQFGSPGAVAVDQGTHDLYVADYGSGTVEKFDQSNAPASFSALGSSEISGFSFFTGEALQQIAVDSTSHDFYVADYGNGVIKAFQQDGEPHEFTAGPGGGSNELPQLGEVCGVATDSNGDIYMGDYGVGVRVFEPDGEELTSFPAVEPCNLAVDHAGNVYVARYVFLTAGIEKFTPSESPVTSSTTYSSAGDVTGSAAFAVAVDPSNDDLYADFGSRVGVYDSSGALRYEFATGVLSSEGVAADSTSGRAYVADAGDQRIHVFGAPIPLPNVVTEDPSEVTDTAATLHGTVNPNGKQLTDCHFEFVLASQFAVDEYASVTPGQQVPCVPAAGSIPGDSTSHAVEAGISSLSPGTTYHFRLVAETAEGTADGPDRVLTTAIGAPVVSAQSAGLVGTTDVTLGATINPRGAKTTYRVEYGTTSAYGQSTAESAPIGFAGENTGHAVTVHIGGLESGTAYHFRFVATSAAGTGEGSDATFATYPTSPGFAPCSNDRFRSGLGALLPDCRAYEQATPVDKHGANIQGKPSLIQASSAGDRVTFYLNGGLPVSGGISTLSAFMASRSGTSWSSDGLLPVTNPGFGATVLGWSEDLSTAVDDARSPGNAGSALYLRDSDTAAFQLGPVGLQNANLAGFAADTRHFIFEDRPGKLPVGAPGGFALFDFDHGNLTLAGRIPAGSATSCDDENGPPCIPAPEGSFAGPYLWEIGATSVGGGHGDYYTQNTISRDGSRVFFTAAGSGQLYVREDGVRTTQISASQRSTPDPNGPRPAAFLAATPDGSKVFFMSCEKLTDDSTAVSNGENRCNEESQGQDLYSYDVDSGELNDLTVDANGDPKGAAVQGVLGASDDGSYVYFVANGVLAPGASLGNCRIGSTLSTPKCNLYVSHEGSIAYITTLGAGDFHDWMPGPGVSFEGKQSRVSADGTTALFESIQSLTGYDNVGPCAIGGGMVPCNEFFRYSAPDEELICVSCKPTGLSPDGESALGRKRNTAGIRPKSTFLTRNLSLDGNRAFFEADDALLPTDTNGVTDVYEWEARGTGSCESESQNGGCLYLISSGTSPDPSYFGDASSNGDHVFFFTSQQLVPTDRDELVDIYDAGVGAGLESQHALATPTCASTACQANPAPPPDPGMASATFNGPGNAHERPSARRCPKGKRKVRRQGKVSCQKAHKKQRKRHSNRGGQK